MDTPFKCATNLPRDQKDPTKHQKYSTKDQKDSTKTDLKSPHEQEPTWGPIKNKGQEDTKMGKRIPEEGSKLPNIEPKGPNEGPKGPMRRRTKKDK
jgi:hypothetical protein